MEREEADAFTRPAGLFIFPVWGFSRNVEGRHDALFSGVISQLWMSEGEGRSGGSPGNATVMKASG